LKKRALYLSKKGNLEKEFEKPERERERELEEKEDRKPLMLIIVVVVKFRRCSFKNFEAF